MWMAAEYGTIALFYLRTGMLVGAMLSFVPWLAGDEAPRQWTVACVVAWPVMLIALGGGVLFALFTRQRHRLSRVQWRTRD